MHDGGHHLRLPCLYVQQILVYVAPPCKFDFFFETATIIKINHNESQYMKWFIVSNIHIDVITKDHGMKTKDLN